MNHPGDNDLALLAGEDAGRIQRFLLERHVRTCADCRAKIAGFRELRSELADLDLPDLNWNFLAADMRANIRLGLEAGACVRTTQIFTRWKPGLAVAFASVLLLAVSSLFLRDIRPRPAIENAVAPMLESSGSGVELRTGKNSLTLLNHHGSTANQTVSAQGDIGARYFDGESGSVTINSVYLQ
jgi:hypothetical protein